MKASLIVFPLLICLLSLSACSPAQPSTGSIQTAVAQTIVASNQVQPAASAAPQGEAEAQGPESQTTPTPENPDTLQPVGNQGLVWSTPCLSSVNDESTVYCQTMDDLAGITRDDRLMVHKVQALDMETGQVLWETDQGGYLLGLDSKNLYIAPAKQRLLAFDKTNGQVTWEARFDEQVDLSENEFPNLVFFSVDEVQQVSIITVDWSKLIFLDRNTGDIANEFELGDRRVNQINRVNNTLSFSSGLGTPGGLSSFGLSLESHELLWDFKPEGSYSKSLLAICGDLLLHENSQTRSYFTVDVNSGETVWESGDIRLTSHFSCPGPSNLIKNMTDVFMDTSENIYFYNLISMGSGEYSTTAVNRATGKIVWEDKEQHKFLGEAGELVLFSSEGLGLISAYSAETHELVWESADLASISRFKIVGFAQNTLIGGGSDNNHGRIVGLDKNDGSVKWERLFDENFLTITLFNINDNLLIPYSKNDTGYVDIVDPESGETRLTFVPPGVTNTLTPVDDLIYGDGLFIVFVVRFSLDHLSSPPPILADQPSVEDAQSFSMSTWSTAIPADVTPRALHYYGVGREIYPLCPEGMQKPRFDRPPDSVVERFTSIPILTCGWEPQETLTVVTRYPNGSETRQELPPWNNDIRTGEKVWRFDFSPSIDEPAGKYELIFQGESEELSLPVGVKEPQGSLVIGIDPRRILLYNFLPNERVRLIAYTDTKFFAWQDFQVNGSGQLLIQKEIPEQGMGYNELFALGEQSQNWEKDRLTIECSTAPATRLGVGIQARVTFTDGQPLNLRKEPGRSGEAIAKIPEGTDLIINSNFGPRCEDDMIWWYVQYSGQSGWVAEAQGEGTDQWFLEPLDFPFNF